jgi:hypothetical protein
MDDISELKAAWGRSSWLVRIYLLVSGSIAISSITSLSDAVVKWKGFIVTGIAFYRDHFRNPIASLIRDWTQFHLSPEWIDYLTLSSLAYVALIFGLVYDVKVDRSRSNRITTLICVAVATGTFLFVIHRAISASPIYHPHLPVLVVGYVAMIAIALIPPRGKWENLVIGYLLVPPLLVCLAAAVNLGLK